MSRRCSRSAFEIRGCGFVRGLSYRGVLSIWWICDGEGLWWLWFVVVGGCCGGGGGGGGFNDFFDDGGVEGEG